MFVFLTVSAFVGLSISVSVYLCLSLSVSISPSLSGPLSLVSLILFNGCLDRVFKVTLRQFGNLHLDVIHPPSYSVHLSVQMSFSVSQMTWASVFSNNCNTQLPCDYDDDNNNRNNNNCNSSDQRMTTTMVNGSE